MSRLPWKQHWIKEAFDASERSTCERLKVGAVIVRNGKHQVSTGYNGSIPGDEHCIDVGCRVVNNHCTRTIHAEANAILQAARYGSSLEGTAIYVTHYPCLKCTQMIISAGINEVYYALDYHNDPYCRELFNKAGIPVQQVKINE